MSQNQYFLRTGGSINRFLRNLEGGRFESLQSLDNLSLDQAIQIIRFLAKRHDILSNSGLSGESNKLFHTQLESALNTILEGLETSNALQIKSGIESYKQTLEVSEFDYKTPGLDILFVKLPSLIKNQPQPDPIN